MTGSLVGASTRDDGMITSSAPNAGAPLPGTLPPQTGGDPYTKT